MDIGKCKASTKSGIPCKANASSGGFCPIHSDPERARELGRKSGERRRQRYSSVSEELPEHPLRNAHDISSLLSESINRMLRGELDPRVANGVGFLSNILMTALELGPLEERFLRVEEISAIVAKELGDTGKALATKISETKKSEDNPE